MAYTWDWKEKCGEITFSQQYAGEEYKEFTVNLYQGNGLMIMLYEWEEEHEDGIHNMYNVWNLFVDKEHMQRCLGIKKGYKSDNLFNNDGCRFLKLRLNKAKNRYWKDIVTAFATAFDDLTIELYSEA